jgi:hypothetical protein
MWLVKQIKKHPYFTIGSPFILGVIAYFILPLLAVVSLLSIGITVGICLIGGVSVGALLGWFIEKKNSSISRAPSLSSISGIVIRGQTSAVQTMPSTFTAQPVEKNRASIASTLLMHKVLADNKGHTISVAGYLNLQDEVALVGTSRALKQFFAPSLENKKVCKLLQYVVYGDEEKAKALLDRYPHFLFRIETVVDYSSRKIRGTAYQIALGAEDIEMVKMMQPYFILACGDEEKAQTEIARQYDAQFTLASKEQEEKNAAADQAALDQVIQAIHQATEKECEILLTIKESKEKEGEVKEIATALQQFRNHLDKKTEEVITTGKHFNMQLLVNALNINHDKNYDFFGSRNTARDHLYGWQVIGYIQRYLPACYAQAFCQGLCYVAHYGDPLLRSLKFEYPIISSHFFPLDQEKTHWWQDPNFPAPLRRLGYDYACRGEKAHGPASQSGGGVNHALGTAFSKLMSLKNSEMVSSCRTLTPIGQRQVLSP